MTRLRDAGGAVAHVNLSRAMVNISDPQERMPELRRIAALNGTLAARRSSRFVDVPLGTSLVRPVCYAAGEGRTKHRMANEPIPPQQQSAQLHDATSKADNGGEDSEDDRPNPEAQVVSAETARNEAEQFRRLAEDAREVRDHHREAAEVFRQGRERLRETAETARAASEEARLAAEDARHAAVDSVRATAESLKTTLEQMAVVEEMRRTLREIRETNKVEPN